MIDRKRHLKRYEGWKQSIAAASIFVIVCGLVAVLYFFYRIVLIATPIAALEQSIVNPNANAGIVCQEDEGNKLKDPSPLLSTAYQTRVQQQKPVTSNMVLNADLSQRNEESGSPTNYSHSIDDDGVVYQHVALPSDGVRFLRVTNVVERSNDKVLPAWQMDPVALASERATYAYSFSYRSTTPIHVSIEYVVNGQTTYEDIMKLDATNKSWRPFTAHFDNIHKATTLRVIITGDGIGQVDTNDFNIHQIADAKLAAGIVSVSFDDGWKSVGDETVSLLQKYNIRTTQYIISETAEHKVAGYMTYDTIKKLKTAGHEIGSHSLNHCNQTELPDDALRTNAVSSKWALEQQKLGPIKSFAYPLGQYNKKTQAVYQKEYPLIRTSDAGYNDHYYDETNISSLAILTSTSDEQFRSWLSYAKEHHLWAVLVYHRIDETGVYNVSIEQMERQLKMVHESGLQVLPVSEAAGLVRK
jgi:peptidoglycan/xylan/chitin deacetylase (PgdA/CDA1 family)